MKNIIIILLLSFFTCSISFANENDVKVYLDMIARGQADEVKRMLPELLAVYPDDPGIKLLHAVVLDDADLAFKMYKEIVEKYPQSQWADDSQWRIIQYYAVSGDINRAKEELVKMKNNYPVSQYLLPAYEIIKVAEAMNNKRQNTIAVSGDNYRFQRQDNLESPPAGSQIRISKPAQDVINKEIDNNSNNRISVPPSDKPAVSEEVIGESHVYDPYGTYKVEDGAISVNEPAKEAGEFSNEDDIVVVSKPEQRFSTTAENDDVAADVSESEVSVPEVINDPLTQRPPTQIAAVQDELPAQQDKRFTSTDNKKIEKTYGLQIASYRNKETAEAAMKKYLAKRMKTQVITKEVNGEVLYAVVIGQYTSKERAEESKFLVREQCNCDPIIIEN